MTALAIKEQSEVRHGRPSPVRMPSDGRPAAPSPSPATDEATKTAVTPRPYTLHTIAARPEHRAVVEWVDAAAYPAFMRHTDLAPWWPIIYGTFPEYQLVLADALTGEHVAHGNLLPFAWDGTPAGLPHSAVEMVRRALHDR